MNKAPTNIDALLEPILLSDSDEQSDAILSEIITAHIEPVIKRVIRCKLHFNTYQATEQAMARGAPALSKRRTEVRVKMRARRTD